MDQVSTGVKTGDPLSILALSTVTQRLQLLQGVYINCIVPLSQLI